MRKKLLVIVSVLIIATLGCEGFRHRTYLKAWYWHIKHGTTVTVGAYVIPVPKDWYVEDQPNGVLLVRLDTDDNSPVRRIKSHAGIMAWSQGPVDDAALKRLMSITEEGLRKQGAAVIVRKSIEITGGTLSCVGGGTTESMGSFDSDPTTWDCRGNKGIVMVVSSTAPDMKDIWDIITHVRIDNPRSN
jgi:hypothetical protein